MQELCQIFRVDPAGEETRKFELFFFFPASKPTGHRTARVVVVVVLGVKFDSCLCTVQRARQIFRVDPAGEWCFGFEMNCQVCKAAKRMVFL